MQQWSILYYYYYCTLCVCVTISLVADLRLNSEKKCALNNFSDWFLLLLLCVSVFIRFLCRFFFVLSPIELTTNLQPVLGLKHLMCGSEGQK